VGGGAWILRRKGSEGGRDRMGTLGWGGAGGGSVGGGKAQCNWGVCFGGSLG
jgi:hypothetical protein